MAASVLQVVSSTSRRGAEVFAAGLHDALCARGRSVRTVALVPGATDDMLPFPTLGRRTLAPPTVWRLRREVRRAGIVLAQGSRALPASVVASLGSGHPLVYRAIGDGRGFAATRARQARVGLYLDRATVVVALWRGAARTLAARYGVPVTRIATIPNAVPARHFPLPSAPARAAAKARIEGVDGDPVVMFLGSLSPEKEVGTAVRALDALPDAHLVVVGAGPERPRVEALGRERAPGRVHFVGVAADPAAALAAADVLVLPSRTEGMPGVLIEAGLSGVPAVASDVGAVREVVTDGETGFVVPVGDTSAFARGVRDALERRDELGRAARVRCLARFDLEVVAERWDHLLSEVAGHA